MVKRSFSLRRRPAWCIVPLGCFALGCQPEFDDRSSQVLDMRVLAVRSEPAEGAPRPPPEEPTVLKYESAGGRSRRHPHRSASSMGLLHRAQTGE